MNANAKIVAVVLALLVALVGLTALVSADSDLYEITDVKVSGVTVSSTSTTQVELEDSITVEVHFVGTGNETFCPNGDVDDCTVDVQVKTWIGGYEYDDVEAKTTMFDVEPGVTYSKTLYLEIPDDLDVEDGNDYTLYVEVYDDVDDERESYGLFAERPRHSIKLVDVLHDASIEAGDFTSVEVRLENLGDRKEEDLKVEIDLGGLASDVTFLDELAAFEINNEDEESSGSVDFVLKIPSDTVTGYYDLTIKVFYDRGHSGFEHVETLYVEGLDAASQSGDGGEAQVVLSLGTKNIDAVAGESSTFTLKFANDGTSAATYVATINGIDQWASVDVSPGVLVLDGGETDTITVTLTPDADAKGDYDFSVQVLDSEGNLLDDVGMKASVDEKESSSSLWKIFFIILIILVILIALIVAFRRLKDEEDDDPLEPKDGQAYY